MQHTPGPWHLIDQTEIRNASGCTVCVTSEYRVSGREQEAIADARIIAAAPDLLAALQTIADSEPFDGESFVCDFETVQGIARAALAKALKTV